MLQILGLREITPGKLTHAYFSNEQTAPSLAALLANPEHYLDKFTEEHRWNLYFTLHHCIGKAARDWDYQDVISFDIDDIDVERAEFTAKYICDSIGIDYQKTGVVMSGHGLQMHVSIEQPIKDPKFFKENRELYKLIIQRIQADMEKGGVKGKCDPSVFSPTRLMRMPGTWNRKPHKGADVKAVVLQPHMEHQGFRLELACGAPNLERGDQIHPDAYAKMPAPDTNAVLTGCEFLKWTKENQADTTESQWYAMLSIVGRLKDGKKLAHEYSSQHKQYSEEQTNFKLQQALTTAGPRTCKNVDANWGKCAGCKYFGTITSPISIQSPEYIGTETSGFWQVFVTRTGTEKKEPAYEDLIKYFKKTNGPVVTNEGGVLSSYTRDTNTWAQRSEIEMTEFAYNQMDPRPRSFVAKEFYNTIKQVKFKSAQGMVDASKRKLNLKNGVYDLEKLELLPHNQDQFFSSNLPYAYDESATAPVFEKFLNDITCGEKDMQDLLLEFMGYAISGDDYWLHKALILYGEGSNGKSTFNKVLKALVGDGAYSSLNIEALQNDQKRAMLEGKLFNLGDENSVSGFIDASIFKALCAGEEVDIKQVYCKPYSIRNRAKLIFNCNTLPTSKDKSEGMLRRLLYVPFNAVFHENDPTTDPHMEKKLFKELPGILNLCIKGYLRLVEQQRFSKCKLSEELISDYRDETRDIDSWFDAFVEVATDENFITMPDAYNSYKLYCQSKHNNYPQNSLEFARIVSKRAKNRGMERSRRRVNRERVYVFMSARLVTGY